MWESEGNFQECVPSSKLPEGWLASKFVGDFPVSASHLDIDKMGYTLLASGFCVGSGAVTKVARLVGQHHLQDSRDGVLV